MIINQKRLRYFYAVHSQGKIRKAADHLNTESSVITRQIKFLEEEIGCELFERRSRGVAPTEAGELLLEYYYCNRRAQENFEAGLQELRSMRRGNVNIATFAPYIDPLMDEVINDFYNEHPTCGIGLQEVDSTPQIINKVLQDEAHIGIIHSHYPDHPDIRCHTNAPLPLYMLVNNAHPLAKKRKGTLSDIIAYPIVQPPPNYSIRKMIDSVEFSEKVRLTPAFISDSISARKKAAIAGYGGVLISSFAARYEIEANQLVPFEIDHPAFTSMKACLIVRRGKTLSPVANRLLRLIETKFSIFRHHQVNPE